MNITWRVVAGGNLWLIFPTKVYLKKTTDNLLIFPITESDLRMSKKEFDELNASEMMLRFVIILQETYDDTLTTQLHAMNHYKYLINQITYFTTEKDRFLLRKALMCCFISDRCSV